MQWLSGSTKNLEGRNERLSSTNPVFAKIANAKAEGFIMSYTSKATPWRHSKKGNLWRRCEDKVLVVGQHKSAYGYWAMCDGAFLPDRFSTEASAKHASEQAAVWGIAAADNSSIEGDWE